MATTKRYHLSVTSDEVEHDSSISSLSQLVQSPKPPSNETAPQLLYSTAQRYQQTHKQSLFNTLQSRVQARRSKQFYAVLCIITFVLSYQCILYLMSDLSQNYEYRHPLFLQYISYSLFPIVCGLPLVKPLWIIANRQHKSQHIAKQRIMISNQNAKHYYDSTLLPPPQSTPNNHYTNNYHHQHHQQSNAFKLAFGVASKRTPDSHHTAERKLSSARSDINSANSYSSDEDEEDEEFAHDSLLSDHIATQPVMDRGTEPDDEHESLTEMGMLSELSFNHIHRGYAAQHKHNDESKSTRNAMESEFSHSKPASTFGTSGVLQSYFEGSTMSTSFGTKSPSKSRAPKSRHVKNNKSKSECHIDIEALLREDDDEPVMNTKTHGAHHHARNSSILTAISNKTKDVMNETKKVVVAGRNDITHIPQSVYFTLDLPFRSFRFYFKKIGFKVFALLFVLNSVASMLWMLSVQNGIDAHHEAFYVESSVHCGRVIVCYILSALCLKNMAVYLLTFQKLLCLAMLIAAVMCICVGYWRVFEEYQVQPLVVLALSPMFNGMLIMYLQNISTECLYQAKFWMSLGDTLFILAVNAMMTLFTIWVVIIVAHYTGVETFEWDVYADSDIVWRVVVIAFLWWLYNVALFIGITLLNSVVMGFGFALIVPCNVMFEEGVSLFEAQNAQRTVLLVAVCLVVTAFVLCQVQWYIVYVLYCASCKTSCLRWIHKKTQYRCYGQCLRCCNK